MCEVVHNFYRYFIREAETPVLWPPHEKSWLIGKHSDAGRDWGQEEKGMTEDEMAGWHHCLNRCEFEWTLGVGDGLGGLAFCDSWGCRVRHNWATELNWTEQGPKFLQSCELEDLRRQKRTRKSQGQGTEPEEKAEETAVQEVSMMAKKRGNEKC